MYITIQFSRLFPLFSSGACITALSRKVGIEGIKSSFHIIFDGLRIHEVVVKIPFILYYVFLSAGNSVYIYIYIYSCIYFCVYIYIHTHTNTHTHTQIYASIYGRPKRFACNLLFRDIRRKIIQI